MLLVSEVNCASVDRISQASLRSSEDVSFSVSEYSICALREGQKSLCLFCTLCLLVALIWQNKKLI